MTIVSQPLHLSYGPCASSHVKPNLLSQPKTPLGPQRVELKRVQNSILYSRWSHNDLSNDAGRVHLCLYSVTEVDCNVLFMSSWRPLLRLLLAKISNVEKLQSQRQFVSCELRRKFCKPAKWCSEMYIRHMLKVSHRAALFPIWMLKYVFENSSGNIFWTFFSGLQKFPPLIWPLHSFRSECVSRSRLFDSVLIHWMWHWVHCCISQSNNLHSLHCTFL